MLSPSPWMTTLVTKFPISAGLIAGLTLALAGCSSLPTTADSMRGHASNVQGRADRENQSAVDWDNGQKLIRSGNRNITAGNKRIATAQEALQKGQEQLALGQRELAQGTALVEAAERDFLLAYPEETLGAHD